MYHPYSWPLAARSNGFKMIQETAPTAMRQIKIKHLASDLPEDHPY